MALPGRSKFSALALFAALGLLIFWFVTEPRPLPASAIAAHTPDMANGQLLYHAAGCHSCHLPPATLAGIDSSLPAGGSPLKTPIGVLYPPNITPDAATGIGAWSDADFINAMKKGIGKSGHHLIPAFPYTSYAHMTDADVLDIKAYLQTLPAVSNAAPAHNVPLLAVVRRGLGAWKWLGLDEKVVVSDAGHTESWNRGAYLVNGPGHCNECHTPRTIFMASDQSRFLAGGPHPEGEGKVPSLRGLIERGRYKDAKDLASALQFGEELGYDKLSSGGMGKVQGNMSKLPEQDVLAIAEYLTSLK